MNANGAGASLQDIFQDIKEELTRAGVDPKHPCHYLSLTTVSNNQPESRYVVLRKFLPQEMKLIFFTDIRSNKVEELRHNPYSCVLGYHPKKKYQLRMNGISRIEYQNALTGQFFEEKVKQARDYNSKLGPGTSISDYQIGNELKTMVDDQYFAVIIHEINRLDWLRLDGRNGHKRALFKIGKDQSVASSWLVP